MLKQAPIVSQSFPCFAVILICFTLDLTCPVRGFTASRPARFELEPVVGGGRWAQQAKGSSQDLRDARSIFDLDADDNDTAEVSKRLSLQQKDMLRRIVYEVSHCMRPCLNNGITLLPRNTVDLCRCVCQPGNYGLACEYELTEEEKRLHHFTY